MALIDRTGFIDDAWTWLDDGSPGEDLPRAIVPFARYLEERKDRLETRALGVAISNDTPASALGPHLARLRLIAIDFPSSADGRGFSLARELRVLGFAGELRARGPLIADQFAFAIACGFDTVEIPQPLAERQPEAQWRRAQAFIDDVYQSGYRPERSILQARHSARAPSADRWLELGGEPPREGHARDEYAHVA